ncbi:efflux RND transporter periplasmic adaptor subunit [Sediminibacterium roseum]|uniref:Efflux RND transporter periplasmic adaptor subunit n=1 Tax=Sediminibacterium roseum TaxID=1978412 RepID=A0ABW9ZUX7_9BACT|nr:efflux RND transporter periplasmic adaptor subunit [Sediminibacterium roseum]NCI50950.1 efflux RND transporter periplasmic adaptor subunit [Sediminibacterium roseum]
MKKLSIYVFYAALLYLAACAGKANNMQAPPPPALPVVKLETGNTTTWQSYPATIEGTTNIEIRPQVSGYLEQSFVQDGAWVNKGQPLFRINAKEYKQFSKTADANIQLAKANIEKAQVEVDRLTPLVAGKVISEVQLKTAKAVLNEAQANYSQALSNKGSADITLDYTLITAPVSGYVGHINFKQGSLIGKGEALPLTTLSAVDNVHAYFSMSEADFLQFFSHVAGKTIEEKIKGLPPVELALADNSIYQNKGTVELVQGQFNKTSGSIAFRAVFPNREKLLRSGISGRIRIPFLQENKLLVPQQSTFELQDKVFVFALGDSNKVTGKQIIIAGKSGNNYVVEKGVQAGDRIVFSGIQRLRDGSVIVPQPISADSALALR